MLKKICLFALIMMLLPLNLWGDGLDGLGGGIGPGSTTGYICADEAPIGFSSSTIKEDSTDKASYGKRNIVYCFSKNCTTMVFLSNDDSVCALEMVLSFEGFEKDIQFRNVSWLRDAAKIKGGEKGTGWALLDVYDSTKTIMATLIPLEGLPGGPDLKAILRVITDSPVSKIVEGELRFPNGVVHQGIKAVTTDCSTLTLPLSQINPAQGEPIVPSLNKNPPPKFALYSAYPNPFNPTTNIQFTLPGAVSYKVKIYNVAGQVVKSYEGLGQIGSNTVTWDGKDKAGNDVASGVYFYKLIAGNFSATEKMVLLK